MDKNTCRARSRRDGIGWLILIPRRMSGERNGGIVMKGRAEEGRENEGRRSALCSKLVGLGSTD